MGGNKKQERQDRKENFLSLKSGEKKNTRASSSRAHETSVPSMAKERQISGEMVKNETKTRITENLESTESVATEGKSSTGRFIVGTRRKIKMMMLTTYL